MCTFNSLQAPTILLLIVYILLYGYVQPFKVKFVNILEFTFLVDIVLLQMIKSTNDIQVKFISCCIIKRIIVRSSNDI